jgi:hypothetical protein
MNIILIPQLRGHSSQCKSSRMVGIYERLQAEIQWVTSDDVATSRTRCTLRVAMNWRLSTRTWSLWPCPLSSGHVLFRWTQMCCRAFGSTCIVPAQFVFEVQSITVDMLIDSPRDELELVNSIPTSSIRTCRDTIFEWSKDYNNWLWPKRLIWK